MFVYRIIGLLLTLSPLQISIFSFTFPYSFLGLGLYFLAGQLNKNRKYRAIPCCLIALCILCILTKISIYNFFLSALLFTEYIIVALLDPRYPIIFGILGISGFITDFFLKSHNICIIILSLFITIRSIWIEHQKKTYQNTEKEIKKTAATPISETYAFKENNIIPNKIDNLDVLSISIPSDENQKKSRNNFVIPKK